MPSSLCCCMLARGQKSNALLSAACPCSSISASLTVISPRVFTLIGTELMKRPTNCSISTELLFLPETTFTKTASSVRLYFWSSNPHANSIAVLIVTCDSEHTDSSALSSLPDKLNDTSSSTACSSSGISP